MHIGPSFWVLKICWYRTSGVVCFFDLEFHTLDMNIARCRKVNKRLPEIASKFAEGGIRHHDVSRFSDLPNGKRRVFHDVLYHFQFMFCVAQSINVRSSCMIYGLYLYIFMFFVIRKIAWSCFQDEPSSLMPSLPPAIDVAPGKRCSKTLISLLNHRPISSPAAYYVRHLYFALIRFPETKM